MGKYSTTRGYMFEQGSLLKQLILQMVENHQVGLSACISAFVCIVLSSECPNIMVINCSRAKTGGKI